MEFLDIIFAFLGLAIADYLTNLYRDKLAKQCNYDCSKCKVWDCRFHICNEKRRKNEKLGK